MLDRPSLPVEGETLLEVRGLTVEFGQNCALNGLDIDVRRGEIVGLLGESGSGKSTAAYAMLGLAKPPGKIVAGSVSLEGRNLLTMTPAELRAVRGADIGLIVQNPRASLHPMLRVGGQISQAWRAHNEGGS